MDDGCDAEPVLVTVKGDAGGGHAGTAPPLRRIELDLAKFHNGRWALQLDAACGRAGAPVVILAQGVACLAVAWWAQLSPPSYLRGVRGAVFRAPLSIGFGQAAVAASALTGPAHRLPFPSIVAAEASPLIERVVALADTWGSRFVGAGADGARGAGDRLLAYLGLFDAAAPVVTPLRTGDAVAGFAPAR